jgi:WD40 repeat protein
MCTLYLPHHYLTVMFRWISSQSHRFVTASRDGTMKVWMVEDGGTLQCVGSFSPFDGGSITAVDSLKTLSIHWRGISGHMLLVGGENGQIQIWFTTENTEKSDGAHCVHLHSVEPLIGHGGTIRKIRWKDSYFLEGGANWEDMKTLKFASCGDDHCLRIFSVSP